MISGRPTSSTRSQQPYKLHALLAQHGIPIGDLRLRLRYSRGRNQGNPIAASTMSGLLLRREWTSALDKTELVETTASFLRDRGIPEDAIASAWEPAGELPANDTTDRQTFKRRNSHVSTPEILDNDFNAPEPAMLSQRARDYFRVTRPLFIDDVLCPEDLFLARDQRYIRESMYQAAKHSGLIAIIGESGSGKSTLRRDLIDRIQRDNDRIVVIQVKTIDKQRLSAQHICDAVIADMSQEKPKASLEARARQVERLLNNSSKMGNRHVLLIEEAHDLSKPTLKYLKRFWELEDGYRKMLGIILIGQPELADLLNLQTNYDLREFIQRCEVATLAPLDNHLEEYFAMKFKRVSMDVDDVIDKSAYDAMRSRLVATNRRTKAAESQCYPLIVQNALIRCMNQAAELGLPKVNADLVRKV
ncbi:MAG: AAA family ATPase [Lysobacteraceae bacterium]